MGLLSILSGAKAAPKVMTDIAQGAINAADALHFSAEEKIEYITKVGSAVIDYAKQTINESSIRSMTRRALAVMFCMPYISMIVFAVVIYRWDINWAAHSINCAKLLQNPVIAVVLFFFGSYGIGYFFDKKNQKG